MLGMLHKTNTITGASHLGAKPFMPILPAGGFGRLAESTD